MAVSVTWMFRTHCFLKGTQRLSGSANGSVGLQIGSFTPVIERQFCSQDKAISKGRGSRESAVVSHVFSFTRELQESNAQE